MPTIGKYVLPGVRTNNKDPQGRTIWRQTHYKLLEGSGVSEVTDYWVENSRNGVRDYLGTIPSPTDKPVLRRYDGTITYEKENPVLTFTVETSR